MNDNLRRLFSSELNLKRLCRITQSLTLTALLSLNSPAAAQSPSQISYSTNHLKIVSCVQPELGIELFYCRSKTGKKISMCFGRDNLQIRLVVSGPKNQLYVTPLTDVRQALSPGSGSSGSATIVQGRISRGTVTLYADATTAEPAPTAVQFASSKKIGVEFCDDSTIRYPISDWQPALHHWVGGFDPWSLLFLKVVKPFDSGAENLFDNLWEAWPTEPVNKKSATKK